MKLIRLFLALAVALAACTPTVIPSNTQSGTENTGDSTGTGENTGDNTGGDNGSGSGEEGGSGAVAGTYTIDFTAKEYSNNTAVTSVSQDGITVAFSNGKWFDKGEAIRAYSSSTITVSSSKKITRIVFTFSSSQDDKNDITPDTGSFTSPDWTSEGTGKVVFSIGGTSGKRAIQKLEVTLSGEDAPAEEGGGSQGEQPGGDQPGTVTPGEDVLTVAWTGVRSGGAYYKWDGKKGTVSSAVYAGDTANYQDKAIQLNAKYENYGIVTTASGGRLAKVSVVWNTNTYTGSPRVLNVYGSNSAYSDASELYASSTQGALVGQITYTKDTEVTVTGDYKFMGLRSDDGAIYLDKICITWE